MSRGEPPCHNLARWLSQFPDWKYGSQDYGIDHARNQNIRRFLTEDVSNGKDYLLMVDTDMVPCPTTNNILTSMGELIYCGYVDRHGTTGHAGNGDFGAAFFRVGKNLLQTMPDPWFKMEYKDGKRVECECNYFRKAAERTGIYSKMVGVVGHQQTCVLIPQANEAGYELAWEEYL